MWKFVILLNGAKMQQQKTATRDNVYDVDTSFNSWLLCWVVCAVVATIRSKKYLYIYIFLLFIIYIDIRIYIYIEKLLMLTRLFCSSMWACFVISFFSWKITGKNTEGKIFVMENINTKLVLRIIYLFFRSRDFIKQQKHERRAITSDTCKVVRQSWQSPEINYSH